MTTQSTTAKTECPNIAQLAATRTSIKADNLSAWAALAIGKDDARTYFQYLYRDPKTGKTLGCDGHRLHIVAPGHGVADGGYHSAQGKFMAEPDAPKIGCYPHWQRVVPSPMSGDAEVVLDLETLERVSIGDRKSDTAYLFTVPGHIITDTGVRDMQVKVNARYLEDMAAHPALDRRALRVTVPVRTVDHERFSSTLVFRDANGETLGIIMTMRL